MCLKSLTNKQKVYGELGFARIYDWTDELGDLARTTRCRRENKLFPVKVQAEKSISVVSHYRRALKSLTNKQKVYVELGFARIYNRTHELGDLACTTRCRESHRTFVLRTLAFRFC